ncbi:MAG TPA: endonuclease/exonuclease/phosphatase family protein [Actinoplanes sp.]|nr:endonuclease/exonuclease/phosphatase family protein [Actinoplanes sp.]
MPADSVLRLRVVSYNIKGWSGDTAALRATVHSLAPDVLVLQEVLRWPDPRTWFIDLAARFGMARACGGLTACGNAVLTSTAVTVHGWRAVRYPLTVRDSPRAAILVRCSARGVAFVTAGSHLSTDPDIRLRQAGILKDAVNAAGAPVVVGADVNETSTGPAWGTIAGGLVDAAEETGQADLPTFPTRNPVRRIDAIFVAPSLPVVGYQVPDTPQTRAASDHFPLLAEVALPAA